MRQRHRLPNVNDNKIPHKTSNYSKSAAITPANIVNPAIDACVADETYDDTIGLVAGRVLLVAGIVPLAGTGIIPAGAGIIPAGAGAAPEALAGETIPAFALAPAPAPALAEAPSAPT